MKIRDGREGFEAPGARCWRTGAVLWIAAALCLPLPDTSLAGQKEHHERRGGACSATASTQYSACQNELADDLDTQKALCLNLEDDQERDDCFDELKPASKEGYAACREQLDARRDLCEALGEDRYDPDFDPAAFTSVFQDLNPYFPLRIGNHWEYVGGGETITVDVTAATKLIEGVTCIVARDVVELDGKLSEDTDDWYGQRMDGTVDYCGESTRSFESFAGDQPETPELVDIEGAWKTGRDGAKSGTQFPGSPEVGVTYRQEWSPGNAEDVARVLSKSYDYADGTELNEFVPQALAEYLCNHDCVVTLEFTPIDPGGFERKYYAPGVGNFLEVNPETGEVVRLVACNLSGCGGLPQP